MLLGFYPNLHINYDWTFLISEVERVARTLIHTKLYKEYMLYEHGASHVAKIPGSSGWISTSKNSHDFFVMGGIPETEILDKKFKETFPNFTFSPATICWTTQEIPLHQDSIKNGQCSLIYPLHNLASHGVVYDPGKIEDFEYGFNIGEPVMINITIPHKVDVPGQRIWFSIHAHEPIEIVKEELDRRGPIIIDCIE